MKSLLKSVLISSNVKKDQQKTILLKKTFEIKATRYLNEFQKYAYDKHFDPKYIFQNFKEFFKDQIVMDFNCIKQ